MIIRRYQSNERFKDYITKELGVTFSYASLNKKSVSSLKDILERIRINLDNRNIDKIFSSATKSTSLVYEKVMSEFYDIEGFTDNLFSQDNFLDCLEKIKIETNLPQIPAPVQMGYMVIQTTLLTHELNKMKQPSKMMKIPSMPDLLIEDDDEN